MLVDDREGRIWMISWQSIGESHEYQIIGKPRLRYFYCARGRMLEEEAFFVLGVLVFGQEIEVVEGEVVVPPFDFEAALKVFSGGRIIASVHLMPSHVVQNFVLIGV